MSLFPKIFATLCFLALCIGLTLLKFPKLRRMHPKLMLAGISGDLGLVLFLEFTRDAIAEATGGTLNALQYGHIAASLSACLLYLGVLASGLRIWNGNSDPMLRKWHKRMGLLAFTLRAIGFLLMFSMPTKA